MKQISHRIHIYRDANVGVVSIISDYHLHWIVILLLLNKLIVFNLERLFQVWHAGSWWEGCKGTASSSQGMLHYRARQALETLYPLPSNHRTQLSGGKIVKVVMHQWCISLNIMSHLWKARLLNSRLHQSKSPTLQMAHISFGLWLFRMTFTMLRPCLQGRYCNSCGIRLDGNQTQLWNTFWMFEIIKSRMYGCGWSDLFWILLFKSVCRFYEWLTRFSWQPNTL